MQLFINEYSLHGQYDDLRAFRQALESLIQCATVVHASFELCRNFYAEDHLHIYSALSNQTFWQAFYGIKDPTFKSRIRELLFTQLSVSSWRDEQLHDSTDKYEYQSDCCSDTSMAEAAERLIQGQTEPILLLNFQSSMLSGLQSLLILKCEEHEVAVDCADDLDAIAGWVGRARSELPDYDLGSEDPPRDEQTVLVDVLLYTRTPYLVQGRRVYEERATRNYMYVDNIHSGLAAHLEVFANRGHHLGTASLDGTLDETTVKAGREFRTD